MRSWRWPEDFICPRCQGKWRAAASIAAWNLSLCSFSKVPLTSTLLVIRVMTQAKTGPRPLDSSATWACPTLTYHSTA